MEKKERPQRLAAGKQPRGARGRRLLPEFANVVSLATSFTTNDIRLTPGHVWPACTVNTVQIPAGARTIRTCFRGPGCKGATSDERLKMPTRGCIRHVHELGSDDMYVGRSFKDKRGRALAGSKWANPFKLRDADRDGCVSLFETHLRGSPALLASLP